MTNSTKKPTETLRDGAIKVTIWKNPSSKGDFYSIDISRTYKDGDNYKDTHSLSGVDILKAQRLAGKAYDRIQALYAENAQSRSAEEAA